MTLTESGENLRQAAYEALGRCDGQLARALSDPDRTQLKDSLRTTLVNAIPPPA